MVVDCLVRDDFHIVIYFDLSHCIVELVHVFASLVFQNGARLVVLPAQLCDAVDIVSDRLKLERAHEALT